jgi:hypothetical protein
VDAPVYNVVAYFLLALVLLSQSQFALLHGRWLWQKTPVSPKLATNWFRYSLLFFLVISSISLLLPTNYSRNLIDSLRIVFGFVSMVFLFILALISGIFAWILSLFFSQSSPAAAPPQGIPEISSLPAAIASPPLPWLEILRAVIFWVVFLSVVIIAIRYYILQNRAFFTSLMRFPILAWFIHNLKGFWAWLVGVNHQIVDSITLNLQKLRRTPSEDLAMEGSSSYTNIRRLQPRQRIIFFYLSLVRRGAQRGLIRKPSQTPLQYEQTLIDSIPQADQEIDRLTDSFLEARYTAHEINLETADRVQQTWKQLMATLRSWRQKRKS